MVGVLWVRYGESTTHDNHEGMTGIYRVNGNSKTTATRARTARFDFKSYFISCCYFGHCSLHGQLHLSVGEEAEYLVEFIFFGSFHGAWA